MSRNTTTELELIYETDLTDPQLQAFLDAADAVVTDNLSTSSLSASTLKQIERFIAAHFACMRDPISLRSKIGDAESWNFPASVTTAFGKGLNLTPYGQQALILDSSGLLSRLGLIKASFRAAPRENSDNFTENLTVS